MRRPGPAPAARATAAAIGVARLVSLAPGLYAFRLAGPGAGRRGSGLALPAVHIGALPSGNPRVEVTDDRGRAAAWLAAGREVLLVTSPADGGAALVTAYLPDDPDCLPPELQIRPLGPAGTAPATLQLGPMAAPPTASPVRLDVVAHISGRGDVRFAETEWVGRLGPGLAIEAFTLLPRDAAAAIECKGLSRDGAETPWLAAGSPCGTTGRVEPLVGFAIRQKAAPAGELLFDCEYAGYFGSGAMVGPMRNGAPCRSPSENDPLEGMQLRITARPRRG